jgi:D-aminoacyl-tRNA deacylase
VRALVQRVTSAAVTVDGRPVAAIGPGALVLLGVRRSDGRDEVERLARKLLLLRIFADVTGRMNDPLHERQILCVSQFTLYADTRRGNRPSFVDAAPADLAEPLYQRFCDLTGAERGAFGAEMEVQMIGDGPFTVLLEA